MNHSVPVLSGLSLDELALLLDPLPRFRARQIFKWIAKAVPTLEDMTDLSQDLRCLLSERFTLYSSSIAQRLEDPDGTMKLQIECKDNTKVEAVLLADREGRKTACISTQVGCPIGCTFCKTGSLGFLRNLDACEIVEQFLFLKAQAPEIANIVVMGMGEPLLNLEALRRAVDILCDAAGLGLSHRRITVSTSGIVSGIIELADKGPDIRLALSLTTADPPLRTLLMPINKTNPLPALKDALLYYQSKLHKRVTLETVLFKGLNTRIQDAKALVDFSRGLDVIINLIPWNPVEGLCAPDGTAFAEPSSRELEGYTRELESRGLNVTRRIRRGRGVCGACGQLGSVLVKG